MKKFLIATAAVAFAAAPAFAQDANNPKITTKGEDASTSQPAPAASSTGTMSAPGDVNNAPITTKGEDARTTGAPPQASSGGMKSSAPGEVSTTTQGGIANPAAKDAETPVAGEGSN